MLLIPLSPSSGQVPPDSLQTPDEKGKGGRWKHGRKGRGMVGRREEGRGDSKGGKEDRRRKKRERNQVLIQILQSVTNNKSFNPPSPTFPHIPNEGVILPLLTSWAGGS